MANSRCDDASLSAAAVRRTGPSPARATSPALMVVNDRHLLDGVPYRPSPNCDARPDPSDISLLVIHAISLPPGCFGGTGIDDLFCNRLDPEAHPYYAGIAGLQVSAHLLIRRDGGLVQYVPFDRRAWHAGESSFAGRVRCNDFSIGVELEGSDTSPFTAPQYQQLATVARALLQHYPQLSPARIVGHNAIAPGRKTDPGPHFDWTRFLYELQFGR